MSVSYLVAWDQAGLAIVAGGLVLACDSGGDEEGKDEIMRLSMVTVGHFGWTGGELLCVDGCG